MIKYTVTYESFNEYDAIAGYSAVVSARSGPEAIEAVVSQDSAAFNLYVIEGDSA